MAYIRKGWGADIGNDFARMAEDTPITLAPTEFAKPGYVIGYIAGNPKHSLGFMRAARVRVHVQKQAIVE